MRTFIRRSPRAGLAALPAAASAREHPLPDQAVILAPPDRRLLATANDAAGVARFLDLL